MGYLEGAGECIRAPKRSYGGEVGKFAQNNPFDYTNPENPADARGPTRGRIGM